MKSIKKNRFLVWLMWSIPIACFGAGFFIGWTVFQIMMYNSEVKDINTPFEELPEIKNLNDPSTFNEFDKQVKEMYPNAVKLQEGAWSLNYERKSL